MEVKSMDVKKNQQTSQGTTDANVSSRKARDLIEDIKKEFRQITWTSREELKTYTQIVVGATFALGMGIYFIDLFIQGVLSLLTWLTRFITG